VLSVAFGPKAPILAAGSWDKTVRVWDLERRVAEKLPPPRAVKN
jgi:WD40 repeat protein